MSLLRDKILHIPDIFAEVELSTLVEMVVETLLIPQLDIVEPNSFSTTQTYHEQSQENAQNLRDDSQTADSSQTEKNGTPLGSCPKTPTKCITHLLYFTFRMPCSSVTSMQWLLHLVVGVAASSCQQSV